jgi:hypothetical protein
MHVRKAQIWILNESPTQSLLISHKIHRAGVLPFYHPQRKTNSGYMNGIDEWCTQYHLKSETGRDENLCVCSILDVSCHISLLLASSIILTHSKLRYTISAQHTKISILGLSRCCQGKEWKAIFKWHLKVYFKF